MDSAQQQNLIGQGGQKVMVNAAAFASKYRSKKESYFFVTVDCKAVLPAPECVTQYFLKQLINGEKKRKSCILHIVLHLGINCDDFKYIYCPQYENISVKNMLQEASNDPDLMKYLPDKEEIHLLPRQYLANVIYTVVGERFAAWVKERIEERNKKMATTNNMLIAMDPEIAAAFAQS